MTMRTPSNGIRNRIYAPLVPRVAARDSAHAHPHPPERSPLFDRLDGVGRAARIIAAVAPEHGADQDLITANQ